MAKTKQTSKLPVSPKSKGSKPKKMVSKKLSSKKSPSKKENNERLKDNIQGITNSAIKRLARQAGILKVSHLVYEEARQLIKTNLQKLANVFINITEYKKKRTVDSKIMYASLPYNMYISEIMGKVFKGLKKGVKKGVKKEGSTRKTSKGSVSLREVKYYQKQHGVFLMRRIPFVRLVREVCQDFKSDLRFTRQALYLLQTYIEMSMVNLFESSARIMLHASRITLMPKDFQLANEMCNDVHMNHMSSEPANNLTSYISKVLKQVHPNTKITNSSKSQINGFLNYLGTAYGNMAAFLTGSELNSKSGRGKKRTIGAREIQTITRILLPGELCKHAVSEATKAVKKFTDFTNFNKEKRVRKGDRAGLQFSVSVCDKFLRNRGRNVSKTAPVYLATVLEYICAEILEISGNATRARKKTKISARDLVIIISKDEELFKLAERLNFKVIGGGYIPNAKLLEDQVREKKKVRKSKAKN